MNGIPEGTEIHLTCNRRSLSMDGKTMVNKLKAVYRKGKALLKGYEESCACEMRAIDQLKTGANAIKRWIFG